MMRVREDRALAVLWLAAGRAGTQRDTERECKCEFMGSVLPQITIFQHHIYGSLFREMCI